MKRRNVLTAALASTISTIGALPHFDGGVAEAASGKGDFEFSLTEAEWRERLAPEQFAVLRDHGTERAFSSPLNDEERVGLYHCAGCDLAIYHSATKFDSGTGWPSFWAAIDGAVGTSRDFKLFVPRTEVHCARCGGHQGHIFSDGPAPTGERHCINGVAMTFRPSKIAP